VKNNSSLITVSLRQPYTVHAGTGNSLTYYGISNAAGLNSTFFIVSRSM